MTAYAKIINENTKQVEVGFGTNEEFYKSIGMTKMDVEQAYNGVWYLKEYAPQKPEPTKEERIEQLKNELSIIDTKSARSMRAILAETATEEDMAFLANLENQAEDLRQQIKDLQGA